MPAPGTPPTYPSRLTASGNHSWITDQGLATYRRRILILLLLQLLSVTLDSTLPIARPTLRPGLLTHLNGLCVLLLFVFDYRKLLIAFVDG